MVVDRIFQEVVEVVVALELDDKIIDMAVADVVRVNVEMSPNIVGHMVPVPIPVGGVKTQPPGTTIMQHLTINLEDPLIIALRPIDYLGVVRI